MSRIWCWLRSWFAIARIDRGLSASGRKLDKAHALCEFQLQRIEQGKTELNELILQIERVVKDAERSQRQYENALETVRTENDVFRQGIDTLVAMNKTLQARYDADMAIQERRRVAANVREEG